MKNIKLVLLGIVCAASSLLAQPVTNSPSNPAAAGSNSPQYWSRQGNTNANGLNNVIGTQSGFNSQIWFTTNGFYRMMMNNGGAGNADGRIAFGNNLPGGFVAQDRLHLHQNGGTVAARFTNTATGTTATSGFQVGITSLGNANILNYMAGRSVVLVQKKRGKRIKAH